MVDLFSLQDVVFVCLRQRFTPRTILKMVQYLVEICFEIYIEMPFSFHTEKIPSAGFKLSTDEIAIYFSLFPFPFFELEILNATMVHYLQPK